MEDHNEILIQHLREQIALEEHACKIMEEQIKDLDEFQYSETKQILIKTIGILDHNFLRLNAVLSKLEEHVESKFTGTNGYSLQASSEQNQKNRRISKMLRDDYSSLNLITMSNTLLHTTALILKNYDVAELALENLRLLAPLVVRLGEIAPSVIITEMNSGFDKYDLSIAETALQNTKKAWKRIKLEQ